MLPGKFALLVELRHTLTALDMLVQTQYHPMVAYLCPISQAVKERFQPFNVYMSACLRICPDKDTEILYLADNLSLVADFDATLKLVRFGTMTLEAAKEDFARFTWPQEIFFTQWKEAKGKV